MAEKQTLFDNVFPQKLLEPVKNYLVEHKETIAVAESVTSGLLQLAFGTVKDASSFFQGGITAYNLGQKYRHLSIEPIHAMECDCVSERVANEMAVNVCTLFNSNWGLGITGYATPTEDSGDEIFAHCSIAYNKEIVFSKKIIPKNNEPSQVQVEYARQLLQQLGKQMTENKSMK